MNCRLIYVSSTFTPVPKRIQDGTEDVHSASITSGAPLELQSRTVRYVCRKIVTD